MIDNLKKRCEARTKQDPRFIHETIALLQRGKKIECVFLKIYESEKPDILNCAIASKTFPKQSKVSKILNKIFKHNSEKNYNQLVKSHPDIIAAVILSGDNGFLKILWN